MSRKNKLMAVPPFSANWGSSAQMNSLDQQRHLVPIVFRQGIEVVRNGYQIFGIELAAFDKHAFSRTEVDFGLIYLRQPCTPMPLCEPKEQPLDLDALAVVQQHLQSSRAQVFSDLRPARRPGESFHGWQLVEQFEQRALGRRYHERPFG